MIGLERLCSLPREAALVTRVTRETDSERMQATPGAPGREGGHQARVETTAAQRSERHVADKLLLDTARQRRFQSALIGDSRAEIVGRFPLSLGRPLPERHAVERAVRNRQIVARQQAAHASEQGPGTRDTAEPEVLCKGSFPAAGGSRL